MPDREREGERAGGGVGERVGPWVIGKEIGRGSFATVYRGWKYGESPDRTPCAIKSVLRSKLTSKLLENLEGEISILKGITHPNIVGLLDCVKTSTHIHLITSFCSGGDLSLYIKKRGQIPTLEYWPSGRPGDGKPAFWHHREHGGLDETVVRWFAGQLAQALFFLRSQNLIHRDIKPQNLLLQPPDAAAIAAGHPPGVPLLRVADFGFARSLPAAAMAETLCGSPLYMAPEILRYEKYDAKADLWSVGAVLYEMAAGKPPFRAQNHVELLRKIERGEDRIKFPAPTEEVHEVPRDLKEVIRALLKRNPLERMSFDEFFAWPGFKGFDRARESKDLPPPTLVSPLPAAAPAAPELSPGTELPPPSAHRPAPAVPKPPPTPARRPSTFTPKYVVGNAPRTTTGVGEPARRTEPEPAPSSATGEVGPRTIRRPSTMAHVGVPDLARDSSVDSVPSPGQPITPRSLKSHLAFGKPDAPVPQPQYEPDRYVGGNTESRMSAFALPADEDSLVGREYVVVEKRAVEINNLADDMAAARRRPSVIGRQSSRGTFPGQPSSPVVNRRASDISGLPTTGASGSASRPIPSSPYALSSTPPFAVLTSSSGSPRRAPCALATSTGGGRNSPSPSALPVARTSLPQTPQFYTAGGTYHQVAQEARAYSGSPSTTGGPGSALARAISMASLRLFGNSTPAGVAALARSGRRKALIRTSEADPLEDDLLHQLEELAQKAFVVFDFADSKLYQTFPQPSPASSTTTVPPGVPPFFLAYYLQQQQQQQGSNSQYANFTSSRRRSTSSMSAEMPAAGHGEPDVETLAAQAIMLYIRASTFLSKGGERVAAFIAERAARTSQPREASDGLNDAVQWFRARYNDCFDKAEFAKSRCGDEIPDSAGVTNKLLFDRAMEIARASAIDELTNEDSARCEAAYETALWILNGLLDETAAAVAAAFEAGVPQGLDEDVHADHETFAQYAISIKSRLEALRRKMALRSPAASAGAVA